MHLPIMLDITLPHRQASIRKICILGALFFLVGCQTSKPSAAPLQAGPQKSAFLGPQSRKVPGSVSEPIPAPIPLHETKISPQAMPPKAFPNVEKLELPREISGWRVTRVSSAEWRLTPLRPAGFRPAMPSLMEDAIITSNLHARLQATIGNTSNWQFSSRAGQVVLRCPELSRQQASALLQSVIDIDKVSQIRLLTTLVP